VADLSAETSMEDILSSIKRIIADEATPPPPAPRSRRLPPVASFEADAEPAERDDSVLELRDALAEEVPSSAPQPRSFQRAIAEGAEDTILSQHAALASRGALDQLSRLVVKPGSAETGTLEGLVREMLRPMLREWLDAKLPGIVESMVSREIERITRELR